VRVTAPTGPGSFAIDAFCCPKAGNALEEYEDAFCVRERAGGNGWRVAIADGATESSFSRLWAGLLVDCWSRYDVSGTEFFERLEPARRLWRRRVGTHTLPWYAEEKARYGAFAAFLGLELDTAAKAWRAVAVGDCCLFQLDGVRPEMRLVHVFPLTRSKDFGSSPYLVGTEAAGNFDIGAHCRLHNGALREEDVLFLASDALSAWLLRREEEGRPAWQWLASGSSEQEWFDDLAAKAREDGVRNDDMTLVRITFQSKPAPPVEQTTPASGGDAGGEGWRPGPI
jgi:hypothetical protein